MSFLRHLIRPRNIAIGVVLTGGSYVYYKNDFSFSQTGLIRFSRAGTTAAQMIIDYKMTMRGEDRTSEEYRQRLRDAHLRGAHRILKLCQNNGGVFIKVGQHIASLQYLLPDEYTTVLSVLHSKAPESSYEDVCNVFESSTGKKGKNILKLEDVFLEFDRQSIGAASLAQVHKARLRSTGEVVAVKIQHKMVEARSAVDIATMSFFVRVADALFPDFNLRWLVEETQKNLPRELNFLMEAENADTARKLFGHLRFLRIPRIYWDLSSKKVLTMEFIEGAYINDVQWFRDNNIDTHDVCRKLGRLYSEMIFLKGKIHADPHFGNVICRKGRKGVELVLLDHGLYANLDTEFRIDYCKFWSALLRADKDEIQRICFKMGVGELFGLFACIVTSRSWDSVTKGIGKHKQTEAETNEIKNYAASLIPQIMQVLDRMPRPMLLILKTNDLIRAIERRLGAHNRSDAFLEMAKSCTKVLYDERIRQAKNFVQWSRAIIGLYFTLFKIFLYQNYLIVKEWTTPKRTSNYVPMTI
ncbi:Protein kinase domain-containing protein [Aphelenchoides besseyi]|nr:Protein kinase domain-containing protein [Aphelenchoides besseyi]